MKFFVLLLTLLAWASVSVLGQSSLPAGYACNPTTCKPPSCSCASYSAPVPNPPQFVVLTFDDSIQPETMPQVWDLLLGRFNPNSCPVQATYFAQAWYTDPILAGQFYARGNEIAIHTVDHDAKNQLPQFSIETEGARYFLNRYAGIPRGKMIGFRHPFLRYTPASFSTLKQMGYTYDSSISENSPSGMWPYTLDYGSVNDCGPSASAGNTICNGGTYPGLWEVPVTTIFDSTGVAYNFDPYNYPTADNPFPSATVTKMYTETFDKHYAGSRAPFGFNIHPMWLASNLSGVPNGSQKLLAVKNALNYMTSKSDVWVVTNAQLIEYMRNPVPASQLANQPYMQCKGPHPSANICNGLNPDLAQTCNTPTSSYRSCYGCAKVDLSVQPNTFSPPPPVSGAPVPDNCDSKWWDPVANICTCSDASCQWADNSRPIQLSGINPNFPSSKTVPAALSPPSPTNTPWWTPFIGTNPQSPNQGASGGKSKNSGTAIPVFISALIFVVLALISAIVFFV